MRAIRWLAGMAMAAATLVSACTTQVPDSFTPSYGASTYIAPSHFVLAIATDATNVYWIDSQAYLWSCSKTACNGNATLLASKVIPGGDSVSVQMRVVQSNVFWVSADTNLSWCPTTGCPNGPASTSLHGGNTGFTSDANAIYWSNGVTIYRCAGACKSDDDILSGLAAPPVADCTAASGCCLTDADCSGATRACDTTTHKCVACSSTNLSACTAANVCGTSSTCVPCNGDAGMATSAACLFGQAQVCATGACGRCTTNADCAGSHYGPTCDATAGICGTLCHTNADCGATEYCTATTPSATGACAPKRPNDTPCSYMRMDSCVSGQCNNDLRCGSLNGQSCPTGAILCRSGICENGTCGLLANGAACTTGASCEDHICNTDGHCGKLPGQSCVNQTDCRVGSCSSSVCSVPSGVPAPIPNDGFAIAGDRVYFVYGPGGSSANALVSCPISGCSPSTLTKHRTSPANSGGATRILAADARSLFFLESNSLQRCDLPTCDGAAAFVGKLGSSCVFGPCISTAASVVSNATTLFVPMADSFGRCARSGCPDGPVGFSPDPAFAPSALVGVPFAEGATVSAFAIEDATIYWAKNGIFSAPGSLIVSTPLSP